MQYLSAKDMVNVHSVILNETIGAHGLRDSGALAALADLPKQAAYGKELYPGVFLKAALYVRNIISSHPFVDGNKRTGAYAFIWFLHQAKALDRERLSPTALTAITLLIAESNPKDKDKMTKLVMMLIGKKG